MDSLICVHSPIILISNSELNLANCFSIKIQNNKAFSLMKFIGNLQECMLIKIWSYHYWLSTWSIPFTEDIVFYLNSNNLYKVNIYTMQSVFTKAIISLMLFSCIASCMRIASSSKNAQLNKDLNINPNSLHHIGWLTSLHIGMTEKAFLTYGLCYVT